MRCLLRGRVRGVPVLSSSLLAVVKMTNDPLMKRTTSSFADVFLAISTQLGGKYISFPVAASQ